MKATHIVKEILTGRLFKAYKLRNINGNIWRTQQGRFIDDKEVESMRRIHKSK